jgi:DNA mismatch repair ATPase MutL
MNIPISQHGSFQTQSLMSDNESNSNFKEINYREQDFSSTNSLSNYFDNLDNNHIQSEVSEDLIILFKDDDASFLSYNNEYYLLDNNSAVLYYTQYLMNKTKDKTSVPLLVSCPLSIDKSISESRINDITKEGFEIDYLDKKTLVLRAFPKYLSHLPHEEIINVLINESLVTYNEKWEFKLDHKMSYNPSAHMLKNLLDNLNHVDLINKKVLKKIKGKDLLGLL